jgi:uncharacterized protein (TIGR03000 family)
MCKPCTPGSNATAQEDEAEYGQDLPMPGDVPEIPRVPTLDELLSGKPQVKALDLSPATIVVIVPTEATLYFDDEPTSQATSERTFTTPDLVSGRTYTYTARAEIKRNGTTFSESKVINVLAGETTRLAFGNLFPSVISQKPDGPHYAPTFSAKK